MVEESVPTFCAFCSHQDPATLAADQDYIRQYEEIVRLYASFASKDPVGQTSKPTPYTVAIRYRKAGLEAIRCVAQSEALSSETARQLSVVIPVILMNLYTEDGKHLSALEDRGREKEAAEKDGGHRRRQSVSTVQTVETAEADPAAAAGTIEDADRMAEDEVGMVALQALRHLFTAVGRGQLRGATATALHFIAGRTKGELSHDCAWAKTFFNMICAWAPVQDRYIVLVGCMETLIKSPIKEDDIDRQLVLVTIIDWLLSSRISFVGLSVMDVLIGLIQHILLILQLGGKGSNVQPHPQQADVTSTTSIAKTSKDTLVGSSSNVAASVVMEVVKTPSTSRVQLLKVLEICISHLATHVYYTDQISDMITAILSRLKPPSVTNVSATAAAIEDPVGASDALASSVNLQEKAGTDSFFSFDTARITALAAIKDILVTANSGRMDAANRSSVGLNIWEGTQWLLRDPNGKVRMAYVDALLAWLNLELKKGDLRAFDDKLGQVKGRKEGDPTSSLAKRAVSNASRDRSPKRPRSTFLPLLHLAVYDNAYQYAESEPDILLLHLLLTSIVQKLGVNAVCGGLPMVLRLQEDIQYVSSPSAKINLGSLVHGYLWALSVSFDFEVSDVGRQIQGEIDRRSRHGMFLQQMTVPAAPIDRIGIPSSEISPQPVPREIVQTESLKPFDYIEDLVGCIADGYSSSLYSPPTSPPGSPQRTRSIPILETPGSRTRSIPILDNAPAVMAAPPPVLPAKVREQLLTPWSKESCIASTTKDADSAAGSMSGSRAGTKTHHTAENGNRNLLAVDIPNAHFSNTGLSAIRLSRIEVEDGYGNLNRSVPPGYGLVGGPHNASAMAMAAQDRRDSDVATPNSSSSARSGVRVDDLKRVLASGGSISRPTSFSVRRLQANQQRDSTVDDRSESMMDIGEDEDISVSDYGESFRTPPVGPVQPDIVVDEVEKMRLSQDREAPMERETSVTPKASIAVIGDTPQHSLPGSNAPITSQPNDEVPPVPPLPQSVPHTMRASLSVKRPASSNYSTSPGQSPNRGATAGPGGRPMTAPGEGLALRNGATGVRKSRSLRNVDNGADQPRQKTNSGSMRKKDFSGLLSAIDVGGDSDLGSIGTARPPY